MLLCFVLVSYRFILPRTTTAEHESCAYVLYELSHMNANIIFLISKNTKHSKSIVIFLFV